MATQRKTGGAAATRARGKKTAQRKAVKPPRALKKRTALKPARPRAARGRGQAAPMFQKIAFTMFHVEDAERARAFYENVLGLTRGLAAPNGVWTEYDLPGGGCLALFCHPQPSARTAGGASVAFEVADLDTLNRRLSAAGVRYRGELVQGPRCRMSNILDSEGNAIILHELQRSK